MLPKIETILYCTQVGRNSSYVFRHALGLARDLGARIVTLHVVETLSTEQEALVEGYVGKGALHAVVERQEQETLARLRRRIEVFCERELGAADCQGIADEIRVVEGRKDEQVLRCAREVGADLIVLGAHAESSLLDNLLGTTAQKVIRQSAVPVLVVQVPEGMQDESIAAI